MTDTVYVTDHSPAAFFAALAEQIKAGFYADDSVEGYPHFDILNEVKLTRTDMPSQRHDYETVKEVHITAWHNTNLVLDYQDAVLQGFEVDPESIKLGNAFEPHYMILRRVSEAAPEAPEQHVSDDRLDALAGVAGELQKVADKLTEAPAPRKGGRPPKIKEL